MNVAVAGVADELILVKLAQGLRDAGATAGESAALARGVSVGLRNQLESVALIETSFLQGYRALDDAGNAVRGGLMDLSEFRTGPVTIARDAAREFHAHVDASARSLADSNRVLAAYPSGAGARVLRDTFAAELDRLGREATGVGDLVDALRAHLVAPPAA